MLTALRALHDVAVVTWIAAVLYSQARLLAARRRGMEGEMAERRRVAPALALEHAALGVALAAGLVLMSLHGWRPGYPRWLSVKLGLVAFVLVPLEGMHAFVNHVWIPRAVRAGPRPGTSVLRDLDRGLGMDDMVRTLAALLLGAALPLIAWLSIARPG